jgi:hypothetical protein
LHSPIIALATFVRNMQEGTTRLPGYLYGPLPVGVHVRYFRLAPSPNAEDGLVCTLHSALLDGLPAFEAVSYVWGTNQKVAQISCDDKMIPITANLDAALRRLRLPDTERTLWVDSLCINQEDRKEQGNQVALMGEIYARATTTIIYLGPDPAGHAENVASLLEEIYARIKTQKVDLSNHVSLPELQLQDPLSRDKRWQSYKALLECQWCSRVWTVQEASLGGNPRILWGTTEIPWSQLIGVNLWLLTKARHVWYSMKPWLNDVHMPAFWEPTSPFRFVELLLRAKTLQCTDERDRIYAFLGSGAAKVGQGGGMIVVPDYEKSFRAIYLEFATAWLKNTHDLRVLSAVEHTMQTFEDALLPSWVPRWDVSVTNNCFGLFDQGFDATRGLHETVTATVRDMASEPGLTLQLRGLIFDTLLWRSDILLPEHMSLETTKISPIQTLWNYLSGRPSTTRNAVIDAWNHLSLPSTEFSYKDKSRFLTFARTLCRQVYRDETASSSDFHPDEAAFALDLCRRSPRSGVVDMVALDKKSQGGDVQAFVSHAGIWAALRRFVLTKDGDYALAPQIAEVGDLCCVIAGMSVPVLLRKIEGDGRYRLVGEAFVLGKMDGEVVSQEDAKGRELSNIFLC